METKVKLIDPEQIDLEVIKNAAEIIKEGSLVAFPTETVYGLGANVFNPEAINSIFQVKGRPGDNPLIVHISDLEMLSRVAVKIPENASKLIEEFWPGPLTLILPAKEEVPKVVTGGLDTVGVRMPDHTVALALISEAGLPIAAPSANSSGKPSPTNAKDVREDLDGKVSLILDSGDCSIGVESTVLDLTGDVPTILRPGGVTREDLESVLGKVELGGLLGKKLEADDKPRSPGVKYKHYSPRADVVVFDGKMLTQRARIQAYTYKKQKKGIKVGILCTTENAPFYQADLVLDMGSREKPLEIANNLFSFLRQFDREGIDLILSESISSVGIGFAVMNRLRKAAGNKVIKV